MSCERVRCIGWLAVAVMAYMEMFGNCAHPNTSEFLRHSVHTYNLLQAEWQQQDLSLTSTQSCSFSMVSSLSSGVLPGRWVQCGIFCLVHSACAQLYKCSVCVCVCVWWHQLYMAI
jgi:hypothetical protein